MLKQLLYPFGQVNKKTRTIIIVAWIAFFLGLFELFHGKVIPSPSKIADSLLKMVSTREFYEDLMASLITTSKAMFYSIVITMVAVYSSTIQVFKPVVEFISKCRYLTLTGLVFVFTQISDNLAEMKMYLLMFGIIPFFVTSFLSVIMAIPPEEKWKGYVNKLNRWETLWEIGIIGKMDMLFEVMRQNFAISWMMITMVEGYAMSEGGVGTLMIKSNKYLNLAPVFAMLIVVLTLGLIFDWALSTMRSTLFPYLKTRK
jgi:ABC-type nitrate/sulfonate/bicarbonate transport system permease component